MISITRNKSGTYTASAFVRDTEGEFLKSITYYYTPKRLIVKMFKETLKAEKLSLTK